MAPGKRGTAHGRRHCRGVEALTQTRELIAAYGAQSGKTSLISRGNVVSNAKYGDAVSTLGPKRPAVPGRSRRRAGPITYITKVRPGDCSSVRTLITVETASNLNMVSAQATPNIPIGRDSRIWTYEARSVPLSQRKRKAREVTVLTTEGGSSAMWDVKNSLAKKNTLY